MSLTPLPFQSRASRENTPSRGSPGEAIVTAPDDVKTTDYVRVGAGSQTVSTGAGNDRTRLTSDAGEPDPAQTDGSAGRINPPVDPSLANDRVSGGQGRDNLAAALSEEEKDARARS